MLSLRQTVLIVAALNLGYFGVEFIAALKAGSVSLLADSADFLEDAAVNILIFFALAWTATRRAAVGKVLAALLLIPAAAFLWTLGAKLMHPTPPTAEALTLVGLGALAVNLIAALLLARHRRTEGSLTSIWPDIVVGLIIAAMNLDAAHEVWETAHNEAKDAQA